MQNATSLWYFKFITVKTTKNEKVKPTTIQLDVASTCHHIGYQCSVSKKQMQEMQHLIFPVRNLESFSMSLWQQKSVEPTTNQLHVASKYQHIDFCGCRPRNMHKKCCILYFIMRFASFCLSVQAVKNKKVKPTKWLHMVFTTLLAVSVFVTFLFV